MSRSTDRRAAAGLCRRMLPVLAWVALGVLAAPVPVRAASTLNFTRLTFDADRYIGIAIANPTAQDAVVTLTAYAEGGSQLSGAGIQNPVQLTVRANQQIARLTSEIFGTGAAGTVAWFQATSPIDGLTGFFLFLDGSVTFLDGADLAPAAQRLIFQQVRLASGFTTEIDLVNPGATTANVTLALRSGGAAAPVQRFLTLPGKGKKRIDVAATFEVTDAPAAAYVAVQSDVAVCGIEFVKDPRGDLLGLNGRPAGEQLGRLIFSQLAVLGDYATELGVINLGSQPVILTIRARKASGVLYDAADLRTNPVTRTLDAGASLREDLTTLFGFTGSRLRDGWLEVTSTADTVNGYLTYGVPGTGAVAAVTTATAGRTRALFSHIATSGYFTGVAALNAGTLAANLRIVALKATGEVLGSYDGVLQPGERIAKLLGTSELIPEAANQNGGLIWIRSDLPLYFASVFGSGEVLANIPPQDPPAAYAPDTGVVALRVRPPLAIVRPGQTREFRADGAAGGLAWKVNGVAGGQTERGTITAAGIFSAPNLVPERQVSTVTAETPKQAGGATVDILEKTTLFDGFKAVQSVAYLAATAKLYVAEFAALGAAPDAGSGRATGAPAGNSGLVEVAAGGVRTTIATFNGEYISKVLAFTGIDGRGYLLLAAQTSGRVIRIDPATGLARDVVTGLKEPSALVFEPSTGDLLVAESDKITTVARSVLDAGLTARAGGIAAGSDGARVEPRAGGSTAPLVSIAGAAGLAVDRCTGRVYLTLASQGLLVEYDPATDRQQTVLSGLRNPGALVGLYRKGVSCPDAFHLLVAERGANRTLLVMPASGQSNDWLPGSSINDFLLLPSGPFAQRDAVVIAEGTGSTGALSMVPMSELYETRPPNPPGPPPAAESLADVGLSGTVAPDPVAVGAAVTYSFTVTNKGPAQASDVTLSDVLPAGTTLTSATSGVGSCTSSQGIVGCSLGALAAGAQTTVVLRVTVVSRPAGGVLANTAGVSARELDSDVGNNGVTLRTTVTGGGQTLTRVDLSGLAASSPAGVAQTVTVRALSGNALVTDFAGTVRFSSNDRNATLPADYTFTAADAGSHTFVGGVTLRTAGLRIVTVLDLVSRLFGSQQVDVVVGGGAVVSRLTLTGLASTIVSGTSASVTVTALDAAGQVVTGYTGSVRFTSTDAQATLPADYTFTAADRGLRVFAVTLRTAGTQTVTVTDTANSALTAAQTATVSGTSGGAVTRLTLSGLPTSIIPGTVTGVSLTATDASGRVASGYRGTVHFTSTDAQATLPADYTFTATDGGSHFFSAASGVTLRTVGSQTVTVADTVNSALTYTQTVQVLSGTTSVSRLDITTASSDWTAAIGNKATVTARDASGNVAANYIGTVRFRSSDTFATVPFDYMFTAADAGVHTFDNVRINTEGAQSLTVTDTRNAAATATLNVDVKRPSLVFWGGRFCAFGKITFVAMNEKQIQRIIDYGTGQTVETIDYDALALAAQVTVLTLAGCKQVHLPPAPALAETPSENRFSASTRVGRFPISPQYGDFNGDGIPDLVVANEDSDNISVLLGKSDRTYQAAVNYAADTEPQDLVVTDLDADGKEDIVVANYGTLLYGNYSGGSLSFFKGKGDGTFQPAVAIPLVGPQKLDAGDLDGDGKVDLVVSRSIYNSTSGSTGAVSFLAGKGDGTFKSPVDLPITDSVTDVRLVDMNGDGRRDLVFTYTEYTQNASGVAIELGKGDGTFQAPRRFAAQAIPGGLAIRDLNGDGRLDVVVANLGSSSLSLFLGNGDGTLQDAKHYVTGDFTEYVAVGDVDGDGKLDVLASNYGSTFISVLYGNGDGTLRGGRNYTADKGTAAVAAADVNGDRRQDLVTANAGAGNVSVFLGAGDGSFGKPAHFPAGSSGANPAHLAAADLNGDGRIDLAVANQGTGSVAVLLGSGSGSFQAPVAYSARTGTKYVLAADFTGDGRVDLAVASDGGFGATTTGAVSILAGNGDGTFRAAVHYTAGLHPVALAAGDFNGDGRRDLAVVDAGYYDGIPGSVLVFLGTPAGTLQGPVSYAAGRFPAGITAADLDGDGKLDLAVTTTDTSFAFRTAVLRGNGDGTFQAATLFTTDFGPADVAAADFDGDGRPELAVTHCCGETYLSIAAGRGGGAFDQPLLAPVGADPGRIAIADFDGDGKPDIAVSNGGNTGGGGFAVLINGSTKPRNAAPPRRAAPPLPR